MLAVKLTYDGRSLGGLEVPNFSFSGLVGVWVGFFQQAECCWGLSSKIGMRENKAVGFLLVG